VIFPDFDGDLSFIEMSFISASIKNLNKFQIITAYHKISGDVQCKDL
jgi:hypothetical protein